jgi:putative copper resistance protein D
MTLDSMTGTLLAARLFHFLAVLILLGGALFRLYTDRCFDGAGGVRNTFDRWLWQVLLIAAIVSLVSSVAWLLAESAILGDGWTNGLSGTTFSAVLFQTEFGRLWIGRLAIAALAILALMFCRRRPSVAMLWVASFSLLLVASVAGTGHAMTGDGIGRALDASAQAVHLIAASVWLGGLVPLGYLLLSASRKPGGMWLATTKSALPRYSQAGLIAVAMLTLSGIFTSWFLVGGFVALFETVYGRLLLAKIFVFLLMVGLAIVNRSILMPRILAATPHETSGNAPAAELSRNVFAEQILAIIILSIVSVLGTVAPGNDIEGEASAMISNLPVLSAANGNISGPTWPKAHFLIHLSHVDAGVGARGAVS